MTPPKTPYEDVWATYPSRKPTFTLTSLLGQNFGSGEGMVLGSSKHPIQHCPTFLSMNLLSTLCSMAQSSFCNSEKCYTYGPVFECTTPAEHIDWFVFRFSQMCSRFTRHHPSQCRSIWWNDPHEGTGSKAGTRAQQNQSKDTLTSYAWKQDVFPMDRGLNSGVLVNDG